MHVILVLRPAVSNVRVVELCWYFSGLLVVVKMRGNVKEYLGCPEVLFDLPLPVPGFILLGEGDLGLAGCGPAYAPSKPFDGLGPNT